MGAEASPARNPRRPPAELDLLGLFGIADRPAESLDELHGRVIGAEVHRVHALVEQQQRVARLGLGSATHKAFDLGWRPRCWTASSPQGLRSAEQTGPHRKLATSRRGQWRRLQAKRGTTHSVARIRSFRR